MKIKMALCVALTTALCTTLPALAETSWTWNEDGTGQYSYNSDASRYGGSTGNQAVFDYMSRQQVLKTEAEQRALYGTPAAPPAFQNDSYAVQGKEPGSMKLCYPGGKFNPVVTCY